ncbi:DNA replication endonuclease-helicase Dna2 [Paecilomyces lecythidis]
MAANPRPFQVSSTSRSKLNAFRYTDNNKDEPQAEKKSPSKATLPAGNADKENQSSWVNGVIQPVPSQGDKTEPSTQTKESKPATECPHTPANRIPLADLISNTEDAVNFAPGKEITPDDHVFWQHVPRSSGAECDETPASRGKKRRHSSSPTSSPIKEPFDMQKFQALLRTPQNDMAAELWNNYVEKTLGTEKVEIPPPRWANLLSSSPQTPGSAKTTRDSSGLRRSNSCTDDWPSSKAKRRKLCTDEEPRRTRNIFSRSRSNVLDSGSSKSTINFLVGKIQENLERSSRPRKASSSDSSPVRESADALRNRSPSPAEGRRNRVIEKGNRIGSPKKPESSTIVLQESSSDFGDDDLDQDLLDLADTMVDRPVVPAVDNIETEPFAVGSAEYILSRQLPAGMSYPPEPPEMAPKDELRARLGEKVDDRDEFDDDDDEFDDDAELKDWAQETLAEYDRQDVSAKTKPPKKVRFTADSFADDIPTPGVMDYKGNNNGNELAVNLGKESSEDEFEDEDFDLEAIESSMLQASGGGSGQVGCP